MNINKNISVWRGDKTPPTIYHFWIKSDGTQLIYNGESWENYTGFIPTASLSKDGLMSKEDKEKLDTLNNTTLYKYRGSYSSIVDLPGSPSVGDTYNITLEFTFNGHRYPAGTNIAWTGREWDPLGGIVEFDEIYSKIDEEVEAINKTISDNTTDINNTITDKVNTINQTIADNQEAINNSINDINNRIDTTDGNITTLSEHVDSVETSIREDFNTKLSDANDEAQRLYNELGESIKNVDDGKVKDVTCSEGTISVTKNNESHDYDITALKFNENIPNIGDKVLVVGEHNIDNWIMAYASGYAWGFYSFGDKDVYFVMMSNYAGGNVLTKILTDLNISSNTTIKQLLSDVDTIKTSLTWLEFD